MKMIKQSEVLQNGVNNRSRIVLTSENAEYTVWVERFSRKGPELIKLGFFETYEQADQEFDRWVSGL